MRGERLKKARKPAVALISEMDAVLKICTVAKRRGPDYLERGDDVRVALVRQTASLGASLRALGALPRGACKCGS